MNCHVHEDDGVTVSAVFANAAIFSLSIRTARFGHILCKRMKSSREGYLKEKEMKLLTSHVGLTHQYHTLRVL